MKSQGNRDVTHHVAAKTQGETATPAALPPFAAHETQGVSPHGLPARPQKHRGNQPSRSHHAAMHPSKTQAFHPVADHRPHENTGVSRHSGGVSGLPTPGKHGVRSDAPSVVPSKTKGFCHVPRGTPGLRPHENAGETHGRRRGDARKQRGFRWSIAAIRDENKRNACVLHPETGVPW